MNAKGNYRMAPLPANVKRCDHGFLGGEHCQDCHPELMCCALCGIGGHEAKRCPGTAVGRRRDALEREKRKREMRNRKRRGRRSDIVCLSDSIAPASCGTGDS
jgi:hypothetical protein